MLQERKTECLRKQSDFGHTTLQPSVKPDFSAREGSEMYALYGREKEFDPSTIPMGSPGSPLPHHLWQMPVLLGSTYH